eukprot:EG_transcript_4107
MTHSLEIATRRDVDERSDLEVALRQAEAKCGVTVQAAGVSEEPELFDMVSWAPAALPRRSSGRGSRPGVGSEGGELLSCSELPSPTLAAPDAGALPEGCTRADPLPGPFVDRNDEESEGPPAGLLCFSHGRRTELPTEWDLRCFHNRTVSIVSVKHRRLLRCLRDGTLSTDPASGDGGEWFVCDAGYAPGHGGSLLYNCAHNFVLRCSNSGEPQAVRDRCGAYLWRAEDAGGGNLFLHANGRALQCAPDGRLSTSPNRRSWETWRLVPCTDHENSLRDLSCDDEPLMAVGALLPLLRSYFHPLQYAAHEVNPMAPAKAMALALAFFLGQRCGWRVALPGEVLKRLLAAEACPSRSQPNQPEDRLSVLSWQETVLSFSVGPSSPIYVVDFDFKNKFDVLRKTTTYAEVYRGVPAVFLGTAAALKQEVLRLSEALLGNFRHFGMSVPWWRTAANLEKLYNSCLHGDACKTHERLAALGALLGRPALDRRNGTHHLAAVLRHFLEQEDGTATSPAGALHVAIARGCREDLSLIRAAAEDDWAFDKETPPAEADLDSDGSPGPVGLLSELFRPQAWPPAGQRGGLLGRASLALEHASFHHALRHVAAHADLCDLPTAPQY